MLEQQSPTGAGLDPTSIQVVGNLLHTIANEVEVDLVRAAYSPVIKESFDCSAAILGPDGACWAQADAIPLQMGVLGAVLRRLLPFGDSGTRAGDVVITNDPDYGVPHLNDFVAIAPVMVDGEAIAYVATLMHHTDVGGMAPGSMPADATELYQEGIRIPPRLVARDGDADSGFIQLMLANTRMPTNFRGDLEAQLSACARGVTRLAESVQRIGFAKFSECVEAFLDYTEKLVHHRLRDLRDGDYAAERFVDGPPLANGDPVKIRAKVRVDGGRITIDYGESSDQVPRPINAVLSNGEAAAVVAVRSFLDMDLNVNDGLDRLVTVNCRSGAVLNPILPAPVGGRAQVSVLAFECVADCLGDASPTGAVASSSGGTTMPYTWMPTAGPMAGQVLVDNSLSGGMGATSSARGTAATDNSVTNAMNYPAELMEQEFPLRVERSAVRRDSGGRGRFAGGDGMIREIRFLEPGYLSLRGHRHQFPPPGRQGGAAGAPTRFELVRGGETIELDPQASRVATEPGDLFISRTPGGGGFGDPESAADTKSKED